jgi:hypothetical protein
MLPALREVLRQMTLDGKIILEPEPDGSYVARSFFLPLQVPPSKSRRQKAQSPGTSAAPGLQGLPAETGYTAMVARGRYAD